MIPGEILTDEGEHPLNPGRRTHTVVVQNTGDRPIQVGSHFHFAETNAALGFDRAAAHGMRLNIASGTAVPLVMFSRMPRALARSKPSAALVSAKW